jgi:hypothetical protein
MKFLKSILVAGFLATLFITGGSSLTSCKKEIVHDTITIIKKDTIRIIDSVCYDLKDSLVAWYKFTGGSLKDSSGKNNDIVFNNATATADRFGKANNAFAFNGNGSYMKVNNSTSLNPNKISMMAIVKFNDFYRGQCHGNQIFKKGFRDQVDGIYGLRVVTVGQDCNATTDTSKEVMTGYYGNNQFAQIGAIDNSNFVKTNKWITVIFTYDGIQAKIYVDGQLKDTRNGTVPYTPNTDGLFIGRAENPQFPYWFNGVIDEIRIYNKALCEGEVKQLNKLKD